MGNNHFHPHNIVHADIRASIRNRILFCSNKDIWIRDSALAVLHDQSPDRNNKFLYCQKMGQEDCNQTHRFKINGSHRRPVHGAREPAANKRQDYRILHI